MIRFDLLCLCIWCCCLFWKGKYKYRFSEPEFQIFKPDQIGNYSSKIKHICDCIYSNGTLSEGIILIYSQYIDAGLIPMALALEEIGFKRCCGLPSLFETNTLLFKIILNIGWSNNNYFLSNIHFFQITSHFFGNTNWCKRFTAT